MQVNIPNLTPDTDPSPWEPWGERLYGEWAWGMSDPIGVWAGGHLGRNGPIPLCSLPYIELLTAGRREKLGPPLRQWFNI